MASDLISRKALLKEIDEHVAHYERHLWTKDTDGSVTELAVEVIKSQPTVDAKDGWIPVEEQPFPQAVGDYFVSGVYEPEGGIPRRIVGEADYIGGKWLIANDFKLEAWRPKLTPYKAGE